MYEQKYNKKRYKTQKIENILISVIVKEVCLNSIMNGAYVYYAGVFTSTGLNKSLLSVYKKFPMRQKICKILMIFFNMAGLLHNLYYVN